MAPLTRPFWLLLIALTASSGAAAEKRSSYLFAVQQELARMGIQASCTPRTGTCTFPHRSIQSDSTEQPVQISVNAATATVMFSIDRFVPVSAPDGPSRKLALRLLSLNREMISCRLDWDARDNTIRLSAVLNTDSNFDRKAFRSILKGFLATADHIQADLLALAASPAAQQP